MRGKTMLLLGAFIGAAVTLLAFAVPLVTAAGDSGDISLSATALAFAARAVGTASDAQAVRLTNVGPTPATISTFRIYGANADDFAQGADCPVAPDHLEPGASCAVYVSFAPQSTGAKTATLEITDDAPSSPQSIPLSGGGLAPQPLQLSPAAVAFGGQVVGSTSAGQSVSITNTGAAPLALDSVGLQGGNPDDFVLASGCPTTLAGGSSCTASVAFRPAATGARSAVLAVADSAGTKTVDLAGNGVASGVYLADGFESGSLAQWDALTSPDASIAPDASNANSGSGSVRMTNASADQSARLYANLAGGGHARTYTRFCFRVAPGLSQGIEIANGRAITDEYPLGIRRWVITYNPFTQGLEGYFFNEQLQRLDMYAANGLVHTGSWYCAELFLDESASGGAQLSLNGTVVGSVSGDLSTPSPYDRMYLWNQPSAGTVWFDDVEVADAPIGPVGAGATPLPGPRAQLSTSMLAFASQDTHTRSASQTVTLQNTGDAPMTVANVGLTGDAGDFAVSDDCPRLPQRLAAGASCSASVAFAPTAAGARSASLSFADDAPGAAQAVTLTGTGVPSATPQATVSPGALSFGDQTVGSKSDAQPVTLTNTGSVPLKISTFHISGTDAADFAQGADCPISPDSLAPGTSCTIYVSFTPSATGARSATFEIGDDAGSSPQTVALSGNGRLGAAQTTLSPAAVSFGGQLVGIKSDAQAVTLRNDGPSPLAITSLAIHGPDAADFAQGAACPIAPQTLAAGASCAIYVSFTPSTGGAKAAVLEIGDDGAASPQSVALSGQGLAAPQIHVDAQSLRFRSQTLGTASAAQNVVVTNAGGAPLTLAAPALAGAAAPDFTVANGCPATLAAGASCTVGVTFAPTAPGLRSATLTIADAGAQAQQSVSLTGSGVSSGVYFADDFESGSLAQWDPLVSADASIALDPALANSGSASVRLTNASADQSARLYADLAGGGHARTYTRFCFRIAPGLDEGIEIANGRAITDEYPLGIRRWVITYNPVTHGLEGYFFNEQLQRLDLYAANGLVSPGNWYCAELYLDESASGGAQLWLNGNAVGSVAGDLSTPSPYDRLYLWNQPAAGSVWFDDVEVSSAPIGAVG